MATTSTSLSTVIGVFFDHKQANEAIDGLRQANFSYERIRLVERGTGHFFNNLKGLFSGQSAVSSNTSDSLRNMGMPEYEAQYYQRELDAEHVLVLMNADERPEEAFNVMRQNGAFDIQSRLRTVDFDDTDKTLKTEEPSMISRQKSAPTTSQSADVGKTVDPNTSAHMTDSEAASPTDTRDTRVSGR